MPIKDIDHNLNIFHWALASIDIKNDKILYYDSLHQQQYHNFIFKIINFLNYYFSDKTMTNTPFCLNKCKNKRYSFDSRSTEFTTNSLVAEGKDQVIKTLFKLNNFSNDSCPVSEIESTIKIIDLDSSPSDFNSERSSNSNSSISNKHNEQQLENLLLSTSITENLFKNFKIKIAKVVKQSDVYDSGIFVCKFIDYISRNEPITFDQADINYFRISIGVELIEEKLL